MLQPKQDKSKVLYDAVSKDYDIGTYDEFKTKLQDPSKRKSFYEGVGAEYDLGSYDDFESKIGAEKKNLVDTSPSTTTGQNLGSEPQSGSLASPQKQFENKPVRDERGREVYRKDETGNLVPVTEKVEKGFASSTEYREAEKQNIKQKAQQPIVSKKQKDPVVESAYAKYKESSIVPDEAKINFEKEFYDKKNNKGFWNSLESGARNMWNGIFDEPGIKVEKSLIADETKEAVDELQKEDSGPLTPERIEQRAKEIYIKKQTDNLRQSQQNKVLESLPEDVRKKTAFRISSDYSTINKKVIEKKNAIAFSMQEFDDIEKELKETERVIKEQTEMGNQVTPELAQYTEGIVTKYNSKVDSLKKEITDLNKSKEKLGEAEEEFDDFKRIYDESDVAFSRVYAGLNKMTNNIAQFALGVEQIKSDLGIPTAMNDTAIKAGNLKVRQNLDEIDQYEEGFRKRLEEVNNAADFANYVTDVAGDQLPNMVPFIVTGGTSGAVTIFASGYGAKLAEMQEGEIKQTPGSRVYSKTEKVIAPFMFGISDAALSQLPTYWRLKSGARAFQSAKPQYQDLIKQTALQKSKDLIKKAGKELAYENLEELGAMAIQNTTDVFMGVEDAHILNGVGDVIKDTSTFAGLMQVFPMLGGAMTRVTSKKEDVAIMDQNAREIIALSNRLEETSLSEEVKKTLRERRNQKIEENNELIKKAGKKIVDGGPEFTEALIAIDNKRVGLLSQADEIQRSSLSKSEKKVILADFEKQYLELQDKENRIKSEDGTVLDYISEKESLKLKNEASRELVKEARESGKENFKITDEEITKRAIKIYNQNKPSEKTQPTAQAEQKAQPQAEKQAEVNEVEVLREQERQELKQALPNAEYDTDGKINYQKLSIAEALIYDNIYAKYDKLISPLLEPQSNNNQINEVNENAVLEDNNEVIPNPGQIKSEPEKPSIVVHGTVNGFGLQYSEGINEKDIVTPKDSRGFLPKEQQIELNKGNSVVISNEQNKNSKGELNISIVSPMADAFGRSGSATYEFMIPKGNKSNVTGIQKIIDSVNKTDLKGKYLINETVRQVKEYIDSNEATPVENITPDGNIQPRVGEMGEVAVEQKPTSEVVEEGGLQPAQKSGAIIDGDDLILNHGTPYDFDKFQLEKIGTGEGVQAFGYGLYFTDGSKIAESYAKKLSEDKTGIVYTVRIKNGRTANWAEWRLPIEQEQEAKIYNSLTESEKKEYTNFIDNAFEKGSDKDYTGSFDDLGLDSDNFPKYEGITGKQSAIGNIYQDLKDAIGQEKATDVFKRAGFDGIKYRAKKGSGDNFNYVVFNPESIEITNKTNAKPKPFKTETVKYEGFANKESEAEVDFDESGKITEIRNKKTGKVIQKYTERKTKKWNPEKQEFEKVLVLNANYSKIEAVALGIKTKNQIDAEDKEIKNQKKKVFLKALDNFTPINEYEAALEALARGRKVSKESLQNELGNKDAKWATNQFSKEQLPSIEGLSEDVSSNYPNLDQTEIRNQLIEIIQTFRTIEDVENAIIDSDIDNNKKLEDQELAFFLGNLSEQELAIFEANKAEENYLSELTDEQVTEYFQQKLLDYEQGRTNTEQRAELEEGSENEQGRQVVVEGNDAQQEGQKPDGAKKSANQIKLYHGGSVKSAKDLWKDSPLFLSKDKSQAKKYTEENKGSVVEFVIEDKKIATEEEAREVIKEFGLESKEEGWDSDELNIFELIDVFFDTSMSDEDIQTLFSELEKKGFEGIEFLDTNLKTLKQDITNVVIFNPKKTLFETSDNKKSAVDDFINKLDQLDNDLKNFGNNNLSMGLPIVISRGAIKAMKLAAQTAKTIEEIISAGVEYIQNTDWYKNLSEEKQATINEKVLENLISAGVKTSIEADKKIQELRDKIKEGKLSQKQIKDEVVQFVSSFSKKGYFTPTQSNALIKKALEIFTKRDATKAFNDFMDYYEVVIKKAELRENLAMREAMKYEQIKSKVLEMMGNGMNLNQILNATEVNADGETVSVFNYNEKKDAQDIFIREEDKTITPKQALEKVKKANKELYDMLSNAGKKGEAFWNKVRDLRTLFFDRQSKIKTAIKKAKFDKFKGSRIDKATERIIATNGASSYAEHLFNNALDKIYNKGFNIKVKGGVAVKYETLTSEMIKKLDEIIALRRIVAIDKSREERGLKPVKHPNNGNIALSEKALQEMESELGPEVFKDLNERADAYFDEFRKILDMMVESGLISKETRDDLEGVDYSPRKFVKFLIDGETGEISQQTKDFNRSSAGLSSDQIQSLEDGDITPLINNSRWLLGVAFVSRARAMFQNDTNKKIIGEFKKLEAEYETLKNKPNKTKAELKKIKEFEQLKKTIDDNPIVGYNKNGNPVYKYDSGKQGFTKAYYYIDGVQNQFLLENNAFDSLYGNVKQTIEASLLGVVFSAPGTLVKALATGRNPMFLLVNIPRDFVFTQLISQEYSNFIPYSTVQLNRDLAKAITAIATENDLLENYIKHGGKMSFLSTQGMLVGENKLSNYFDNEKAKKVISVFTGNRSKKEFTELLNVITLHELNYYSELMFRLAVFDRAINNRLKELKVKSIEDLDIETQEDVYYSAVASARSILDFNQGGSLTKAMEPYAPYINASTQGLRSLSDALKQAPLETTTRMAQLATIPSLAALGFSYALIAAYKDDEDERTVTEIYLDNKELMSKHHKKSSYTIDLGIKNEKGMPRYLKIAKEHQMMPFSIISEHYVDNYLRRQIGRKEVDDSVLYDNFKDAFFGSAIPIDPRSPESFFAKNPLLRASLTYRLGYDFYRNEFLSRDINKDGIEKSSIGFNMDRVEDFYKVVGEQLDASPLLLKAGVESIITSPETNPHIGMIYGGLDVAVANKDVKDRASLMAEKVWKNMGKRLFGEGSEYNKTRLIFDKLEKQFEKINTETRKFNAKIDDVVDAILDKEITVEQGKKEILEKFKGSPERIDSGIKRIENRILDKDLDPFFRNMKYVPSTNAEDKAKMQALMLYTQYGNTRDRDKKELEKIIEGIESVLSGKEIERLVENYVKLVEIKETEGN